MKKISAALAFLILFSLQTFAQNETLRGDEAIKQLQQTGQYDSLIEAVRDARKDNGQTEEPQTEDAVGQNVKLLASDGAFADAFGYSVAISGDTAIIGAINDDVGVNSDQGSAYIFVRSGTTWTEQQKLTASDGAASDFFGYSVAISGETAIVGAPLDDVGANFNQGSAYIFVRSGMVWSQQQKLTASDGAASDDFGISVAINSETVIVGAVFDDVGANSNQGSAYIFVRSGVTWTEQQKLTASDGAANDNFGNSVAISGETAIVGAPLDDVGANTNQGSAYIFVRSGGVWTQQAQLNGTGGVAFDNFGNSVAISGDTAIVGVNIDDVGENANQGSAHVFVRSGVVWTQQQQLTAHDGAGNDNFGFSVAISGNNMIVGAYQDDVGANADQGSAYVYRVLGGGWTQEAQQVASDGVANDQFGNSVSISGDTAIIGANVDDVGANADQGSAYIFVRSGTVWTQQQKLTASDGAADDQFGISVAIYGDTAIVGAYLDDVGAINAQGSAYVFVRSGTTWTQQQKLTASDGALFDQFGSSVGISGESVVVGAQGAAVGINGAQGAAYVFTRSGTTWTQQQKLTASDGAATDAFGSSAAISFNTIIVGAPQDEVGAITQQGSAYIFTRSGVTWTQQQKLTASDGAANDFFGNRVGLSGETAVVGAFNKIVGGNAGQGAGYVFTRSGVTWTQQQKLTASDGATNDQFGFSVSIDGDTAVFGAASDDVGANVNQGSAYVFVRNGTVWTQQQQLISTVGATNDQFGSSVGISGDKIIVGARLSDASVPVPLAPNAANQGAMFIFINNLIPLASNVSVGGRILSAEGNGVRNAIVSATLANGEVITTRSTAFGYYNFENLEAGQTVVLSVISKRFQFIPQVVTLNESISELDFIAQ